MPSNQDRAEPAVERSDAIGVKFAGEGIEDAGQDRPRVDHEERDQGPARRDVLGASAPQLDARRATARRSSRRSRYSGYAMSHWATASVTSQARQCEEHRTQAACGCRLNVTAPIQISGAAALLSMAPTTIAGRPRAVGLTANRAMPAA